MQSADRGIETLEIEMMHALTKVAGAACMAIAFWSPDDPEAPLYFAATIALWIVSVFQMKGD